jgi:hypothetical protein
MHMCVLGLCVYVRAGRPGQPGTRPTGEDPSGMSAGMSQVSMSPQVFGTTHLSSPSSFVALSIASYRCSSPVHSADIKNEFVFHIFKIS